MDQEITLLKSVLLRNNFSFEKNELTIFIKSIEGSASVVKYYQLFSIISVIVGLLILPFSLLFGLIILFSTVPLYFRILGLKSKRKEGKNKIIEINTDEIIISNDTEISKIKREDINSLSHSIDRNKDISVGTIYVITDDKEEYTLMNIFGDDKRYVQDDIEIITEGIVRILNE